VSRKQGERRRLPLFFIAKSFLCEPSYYSGEAIKLARLVVHLRDAYTNAPIPFTAVFVGSASAVSNMAGDAVFDLPAGSYTVSAKSPMYAVAPGAPTTVSVPGEVTVKMARVTL